MKQWPPLSSASPIEVMASPRAPTLCGRGDKKTKKGKRFKGSYGNARPKKEKKIERIKDKVEVPSTLLPVFPKVTCELRNKHLPQSSMFK
ncbi:hypothetical protein ES319_D13G106400v1 [Gossypium barbadense]|uniref:30S ribosomal protein S31, mitochondrial n=3 Tax=Gossypium TaxID=3633 RepID=A0A5J5NKK6_GOSBA|nr:hypothetical protein ES319_D13G106400v1 [Gossypium barbadense]TYH34234.1 hypothetical protein ES332_D13G113700v1 [Gossypium tomentosum]